MLCCDADNRITSNNSRRYIVSVICGAIESKMVLDFTMK